MNQTQRGWRRSWGERERETLCAPPRWEPSGPLLCRALVCRACEPVGPQSASLLPSLRGCQSRTGRRRGSLLSPGCFLFLVVPVGCEVSPESHFWFGVVVRAGWGGGLGWGWRLVFCLAQFPSAPPTFSLFGELRLVNRLQPGVEMSGIFFSQPEVGSAFFLLVKPPFLQGWRGGGRGSNGGGTSETRGCWESRGEGAGGGGARRGEPGKSRGERQGAPSRSAQSGGARAPVLALPATCLPPRDCRLPRPGPRFLPARISSLPTPAAGSPLSTGFPTRTLEGLFAPSLGRDVLASHLERVAFLAPQSPLAPRRSKMLRISPSEAADCKLALDTGASTEERGGGFH